MPAMLAAAVDALHALAMVAWIGGLKVQVNVIAWNRVPDLPFTEPTRAELEGYVAVLEEAGITASRRMRRGRGVMGACGQLGDTLRAPSADADSSPP